MISEIRLLRPLNCIMSVFAVIISIFIVIPFSNILSLIIPIILASASAFLITGAGNTMNDYTDRDIDKIAHKERPIPHEDVTPKNALILSISLIILSLISSLFINIFCFLIALLAVFLEIGYATFIHKKALGKNFTISILVALLFIYGGAAVNQPLAMELLILAMLSFIINMAREVIKDVEDVKADIVYGRKTLPIRKDIKTAKIFTFSFLIIGIVLSPMPYFFGNLSQAYLPIVAIADVVFLYSIIEIPLPNLAKNSIKIGMSVALIAFIAGAFL